ncbi:hypothetical protein [Bacillus sp. OV166]|nr:hypothetical protein [Bacillus sp. OV166]
MDIRKQLEKVIDTRGLSDSKLAELQEKWSKNGAVYSGANSRNG